jgi:hypothetical protein
MLNMKDGAARGTPCEQQPSGILLGPRIVPRTPLRIIEARLNVDQDQGCVRSQGDWHMNHLLSDTDGESQFCRLLVATPPWQQPD